MILISTVPFQSVALAALKIPLAELKRARTDAMVVFIELCDTRRSSIENEDDRKIKGEHKRTTVALKGMQDEDLQ